MLRSFLELFFLLAIDVRPLAFGESIHEERPALFRKRSWRGPSAAEKNDAPVAFRSPLSGPGDPLFDDLTAKVGIDLSFLGSSDGLK
ncbi:MAG TPA: hypothetical protein VN841_00770 [Bryobacteraceae bacterium]|nr:hypothetical protein [Bryobacteraceae bacterium]